MDQIKIKELEVFARHGVFPEENKLGQKFLVNAVIYADLCEAASEDDIHKSIHYGEICEFITDYMRTHTYKLIETVAEKLAEELLVQNERIHKIEIEVVKPWAPIGLPVTSVSVCMKRGWHMVYLSVGSNMGDRRQYLDNAVDALRNTHGVIVEQTSDWIETPAYGKTDQDPFLNGVIRLKTFLEPIVLLHALQQIERQNGRERKEHWGPRTLDLDILFYDHEIIDEEELVVPHPDLQNRAFVLEPFAQIDDKFRHPLLGLSIQQMLERL